MIDVQWYLIIPIVSTAAAAVTRLYPLAVIGFFASVAGLIGIRDIDEWLLWPLIATAIWSFFLIIVWIVSWMKGAE